MTKLDLFEKIDMLLQRENLIICIAGRSCSGKSTLAEEIKKKFFYCNPVILCQDMWYKDLPYINRGVQGYYNMENLQAFEVFEYQSDVENLRVRGHCFLPYYDISQNRRMAKGTEIKKSSLIILEGLHTVEIFERLDSVASVLYIFVDTSLEECVRRRVDRDKAFINLAPDFIREHYLSVIDLNYRVSYDIQKEIVENKGSRGVLFDE